MGSDPEAKGERLQVALARFGLASRRGVVSLIEQGKVVVNGSVVREKGFRVHPADEILVEGQKLASPARPDKRYFLFHKPKGVMTTLQDPHAERTVADFFKGVPERLFPVGRLDRDTTGLLLMTNDGELAFRLTHPRFGVDKVYKVCVKGAVTLETAQRLAKGVELEEGKTAPCRVHIERKEASQTWLSVTLHEGKKRQVRRVFERAGHPVIELERVRFGPLSLGEMKPGEKRELTARELKLLKQAAGL